MVYEFAGRDLRTELVALKNDPLPCHRIRIVLAHVGSALRNIHGQHLIHADVKPGNILVEASSPDWLVRLGDVGAVMEVWGGISFSYACT